MDHNRRTFIKNSALISAGTMLIPNFLKALEASNQPNVQTGKILVIVQLSGGNDGLNTVIPYRNDLYYNFRPQLSLPQDKVLKASDELGFHPSLQGLNELYDEGYLAVVNNVGYPNPDRSHFRSMDIWQTASNADENLSSGWIGRYLDASCQSCNTAHKAIEIDDTLSLALKGESIKGLAMRNPKRLHQAVQHNFFRTITEQHHGPIEDPSLHYLYKTVAETVSSADYIYNKTKIYQSKEEYPKSNFGNRMKTVAELICSGIETQVYYVPFSGFDTHINQAPAHERLLKEYADTLASFVADLESNNRFNDVLIMTFSEFGRRVAENASGGTDHGTANNIFIIGKSLRQKGFVNETPDLKKLDEGDLVYQIDFRSIYATLLNKWLEADDKKILNNAFKILDFV